MKSLVISVDLGDLGMTTVRTAGDYPINVGDDIFLSPDANWIYRFDKDGTSMPRPS